MHERRRGGNGYGMRHLISEQYMAVPSTYRAEPVPTLSACGKDGRPGGSSTIDHSFILQGYIERVTRVHAMTDLGARVQVIKGTPPRDHLPLLLVFE
eukprot:3318303-Pyramimonas_sp.AAC.1